MRFQDKVVIVTGSGAGIGRSTALAFAREGAKVIVNSTKQETGAGTLELLQAQGCTGTFVQGDVSNLADVKNIVSTAVSQYGTVDILVNVAGVVLGGNCLNTTEEDWNRMMDVNAKGTFYMMRETLPIMLAKKHGSIVNVSSIAAQKGLPNRFGYCASKGAVSAMTHSAAAEYIRDGIRCNLVCPGTILTPSLQARIDQAEDPVAEKQMFFERQPIGRLGTPEEIAEAVLFAADDACAFMTSTEISVNGGMLI